MATFKLIEDVKVIYFAETIQGKVELDGEIVEFRYSENSNGSEHWILINGKWESEYDEKYEGIILACGAVDLSKDSKAGKKFNTDDYSDDY